MMSGQQMTDLGRATGTGFDRMWLQLMTAHHQGAVASAKTEPATGQNAQAKALAQSVVPSQRVEIAQMATLMTALPPARRRARPVTVLAPVAYGGGRGGRG